MNKAHIHTQWASDEPRDTAGAQDGHRVSRETHPAPSKLQLHHPMPNVLFVSFDAFRPGEVKKSYAISSIIAHLKQFSLEHPQRIDCCSFNLFERRYKPEDVVAGLLERHDLRDYDMMLLPDYAWATHLTQPVVAGVRSAGFEGKVVLGGYEVTATPDRNMAEAYPYADHCIRGYAERAVLDLLTQATEERVLNVSADAAELTSPYLTGEMPFGGDVRMVRWETKRGCPYTCGFCEWASVNSGHQKISHLNEQRLLAELALFARSNVEKINVLDPTFNTGNRYLRLLEELLKLPRITFSLQTRLELIATDAGERFLALLRGARNIRLEVGIQTVVPSEMATIGRRNDLAKVDDVLRRLADLGIDYEASLIYGIPGQTLKTFRESIAFLTQRGCSRDRIRAFPLRIPKYSPIGQDDPMLQEGILTSDNCECSVVQASSSFGLAEWTAMRDLAEDLGRSPGRAEEADVVRRNGSPSLTHGNPVHV